MRRLVMELLREKQPYRSSTDEDSVEQVGGLPPAIMPREERRQRAARVYDDEQVESALDLLSINSLPALGRADFQVLGKKQSWKQLAEGVVQRLASDLLQLKGLGEARERGDLLFHRLETRRNARVRTPFEIQQGIETVFRASKALREVDVLSRGALVRDVDGAVGRMSGLMGSWRGLCSLSSASPSTERMIGMVKEALGNVIRSGEVSGNVKTTARRVLLQWSASGEPVRQAGEQVDFDSD